uniref:Uncharacterized protein n=1 Tax=Panthera leo TaxID=9689 RepID=A0A8C8YFC8_PANLE
MAARGPLPPDPGHRKPREATWWAGAGNPQRGEGWSVLAGAQGSLEFWGGGEGRGPHLISPESPLRTYVSVPPPHGPLARLPVLEIRRPNSPEPSVPGPPL